MRVSSAIGVGILVLAYVGCGKVPTPDYARQLSDANPDVRLSAARALDQPGNDTPATVEALSQAIADSDVRVRRIACHALGRMGPEARPATARLIGALDDREISVRLVAAFALQKIDPAGKAYVPVLTQAMLMGEGGAIVSVGKMGPAAAWAAPTLRQLLQDRRPNIRRLADEALQAIGPGDPPT